MKFLILLFSFFSCLLFTGETSWALITESDLNVRNTTIDTTGVNNPVLDNFIYSSTISDFFFSPGGYGGDGIMNSFISVAFNIKNFFIIIAVFFLIIGVVKLLFLAGDEESTKKWRSNIIWVSVGILVMQIAFSIWNTLIMRDTGSVIGSMLGWQMWVNIFSPIVNFLQLLAGLGFLAMMIYAFFTIVGGGGDEEKLKKGKNIVLYAVIGFVLIRLPRDFISAIYGKPNCKESEFLWTSSCVIKNQNLKESINIVGDVFNYLNSFLGVLCVLLVIYAGWLVFISGGDEEKLKKAKHIILYIIVGLLILVASHAIFRFFILKG